jgi:3-phosphoglycerate kinase
MKYLNDLEEKDLKGKYVLLRLDLNVPIVNGEVHDTFRLDRVIETVDYLRLAGARTIIISHIESGDKTLVPVWHYLNGFFPLEFSPTYFTAEAVDKVAKLEDKGVILFENLRVNPGEKENDEDFAKKLSQMAEIYVNDAFAVSHRKHASIVMGNDGQQGILGNIVVGAVGAFIGGWIMSFLNGTGMTMGFDIRSLAVATVGAIVLLFVKNKLLG